MVGTSEAIQVRRATAITFPTALPAPAQTAEMFYMVLTAFALPAAPRLTANVPNAAPQLILIGNTALSVGKRIESYMTG